MAANSPDRDRRDWTIIIFLLPIGILLMIIAGQIAIRLVPSWSVNGGMQSNLDPANAAKNQAAPVQPISFDILTPMSWLDNFLTPGPGSSSEGISFPPFIVFEPSSTPSPIATPTASDTPITPSASPTSSGTPTGGTPTKKPGGGGGSTATPTATTATASASPTTPAPTCTDTAANNNGGPLPCTYSSSPLVGSPTGVPSEYNNGTPDGSVASISDGTYIILNLPTPIVVTNSSDTNYDFVYYERATGGGIDMDRVILSISVLNTGPYYVVFNWGDGTPDTNSNVASVAGTEADNQHIDSSQLYQDPSSPSSPDTGILVDVDHAPSSPPPGNYSYLAIQAPVAPPSNDGADVDSVQVTEVASPFP